MTKPGTGPKQLEDLLAVMPYATVIVDQQGRIALANSLAEKLFGYGPNELPGRPVEMLVPERFRDQHIQLQAGYAVDPQLRPMGAGLELYGRRQDGSEFPAEIALTPLPGKGSLFVLAIIRDISDRKAKEDTLRHSREQLHELSARLLAIREKERTRIARVIHDELGQALTGLKRKGRSTTRTPSGCWGCAKERGCVEVRSKFMERQALGPPLPSGCRWAPCRSAEERHDKRTDR